MKFNNIIWDGDEYYSEEDEIEEIPCDRCGRIFPINAFQSFEDYDHCCWDCCCHLEDPMGYPFDPKIIKNEF